MESTPDSIRMAVRGGAPLLDVQSLEVSFDTPTGRVKVVEDMSFTVGIGERVALVGESGSGKSMTARAIVGLLPKPGGSVTGGRVFLAERNLLTLAERELRDVRGAQIATVFQDPMSSLNPLLPIGTQVAESLIHHKGFTRHEARRRAIELLDMVRIPNASDNIRKYPHEFSGGMRQRAMIAAALSCDPQLLIADEPTTALDVTVQAEILELLHELSLQLHTSILLITHDLGIVAQFADRIVVMYAGRVVESADAVSIFTKPAHPYSADLLAAIPRVDSPRRLRLVATPGQLPPPTARNVGCSYASRCTRQMEICLTNMPPNFDAGLPGHSAFCWLLDSHTDASLPLTDISQTHVVIGSSKTTAPGPPLIEIQDLSKTYAQSGWLRSRHVQGPAALDSVSFDVDSGETLAIVGESGSGKTTLAHCIAGAIRPTEGHLVWRGTQVDPHHRIMFSKVRREVQMVFQDPSSSLNPRMRIGKAIEEAIRLHGLRDSKAAITQRAAELLEMVGLHRNMAERLPHELSGGEQQRVAIARALSVEPTLIICDEPVSSLDVSVQAQVLNLLLDLQEEFGLTYIFITHDLGVVRHVADRILVLHRGRIVECGQSESVLDHPTQEYTKKLLTAIPVPDPLKDRRYRQGLE